MSGRRLTRTELRGWLEFQPKTKIVGYSHDRIRCPLATYLGYSVDFLPKIPEWANQFIMIMDGERPPQSAMTVEETLAILDRVSDLNDRRGRPKNNQRREDASEEVEDFDLLLGEI